MVNRTWWILALALAIGIILLGVSQTDRLARIERLSKSYVTDGQGGYLLDHNGERILEK